VQLLFLDESGRLDQGTSFALGGIAVRDADWSVLRDLWQETLREAGWPLHRELKWHVFNSRAQLRQSCSDRRLG
jgi:hypothetical protein